MDKETLSNYGWIVICVLVLAVMLALATPFGTFVADGFKATYTGLFQTGDNAMDTALGAVGVSNKLPCGHGRKEAGDHSQKGCGHYNCQDTDCGCVPASCGVDGHWSGDGMDHTTKVNHTGHTYACQCSGWVVPEGGIYYTGLNQIKADPSKATKVYHAGEQLPCGYVPKTFDLYEFGEYLYDLNNYNNGSQGWGVRVLDKTKSSYGTILTSIRDIPVADMSGTFKDCVNLTTEGIPEIPNTVVSISSIFSGCKSIISTKGIVIPENVTNAYGVFQACSELTDASNLVIPGKVTTTERMFYNCMKLKTAPDLSGAISLTDMSDMFVNCQQLESPPVIPNNVITLNSTFCGCDSLSDLSIMVMMTASRR